MRAPPSCMPEKDSPLMTLDEIAAYLRVHKSTIYRMIKKKKLRAFKLGDGNYRVHKSELDRITRGASIGR